MILECDLSQSNIKTSAKCGKEVKESINLCEKGIYDKNKFGEKNYIQYLKFVKEVKKYINEKKNKLKIKPIITLELTPFSEKEQNDDSLPLNFPNRQYYKDINNVECESSFNYNGKKFIFKDKNVLIFGIHGKAPGFIFLINELCNDDYEDNN